ncbi:UDP-N-acetylenolpyruvoylglucosamine reductase [Candidatus Nomurabacteria bacterium CG1_02_31_12]|uniref:UDP-N-acetylenolpyruvoylglucosamine reductase n=1 Tax=Candidatus Nomurabacteria bacterium CG1_02_31_12 TaxID=1805280 RepID=A0A1J4UW27_9BACT|nr:MAG: UDP-N-acetylenolpyruvoylglucosamine reductase [Candidatus Nomurabacteria bacterium CG1_02_31_12]
MKIIENYDLVKLNTFGVFANAQFFIEINNEDDLKELFSCPEFKDNKKLFLGGGSNVLFTKDFNGIVILNKLKGIEILDENLDYVFIKSMGGEKWHDLVSFTVDRGYWGIENLSLIPGTVGAAPVQNIGAYGVEIKDILENIETYDIEKGEKKVFKKEECEFGYRDSIFKNKLKNKYFIFAVTLKLNKKVNPNVSYKVLQEYLEKNKIEVKSSKDISDVVVAIRKSKLPDPVLIGNAGSFFKNVYVNKQTFEKLILKYPDLSFFEEDGMIKIPAGWLIEKCGPIENGVSWKGYRKGNVGVHKRQALVIVNYGGATGEEIKNFSEEIINSVYYKFGLKLEREVNLI